MAWFAAAAPLLPEILTRQARWQGNKTALVMGDQRRCWRQFERASNQVAQALAASGVAHGDAVVLLMSNSLEMVEAMFGILKAGAIVVPLNTSVSDAAIGVMTQNSRAVAVFASREHLQRVDALRTKSGRAALDPSALDASAMDNIRLWVAVDPPPTATATWQHYDYWRDGATTAAPLVSLADDDVCNIIYSSGTTGLPKGIVHTHRRRLDWAYDLALALRYHSGCVTLCTLGLYSNISWVSLLCTLLTGGTVVVADGFNVDETLDLIVREKVTHSSVVPLQLARLLEAPRWLQADLSSLQSVMCCGSPLPLAVKRAIAGRIGGRLIELYGLTEGVITTLAPEDLARKLGSVGKPIPGTDLRIIDEQGRELPQGHSGEIVGLGRILMSGYHARPDANAEASWVDEDGRRWLRTGDIGRLDADGFLYIVDRAKDMIISGGQNIYPADIEAVLTQHPQVREAAVIGVASEQWGETPLALVVARADTTPAVAVAICEWTNARLGRQQRLSGVVLRQDLPRNANGKILKRELRGEYRDAPSSIPTVKTPMPVAESLNLPDYAEHFVQSTDGLRLYCREYGAVHASNAAPTVICLPGLTRNCRDFHRLALALASTHRVVTTDFRGRGRSDYDPNWKNYQPPTYAQDVLTIAAALRLPRVFLIGTSLGGMVAMIVAALRPALLAGVVLNDIGPEIDAKGLQRIDSYVGKLPPVSSWSEAAAQARHIHQTAMPNFTNDDWMYFVQCTYRDDGNGHPLPDMDVHIGDAMRAAPAGPAPDLWPLFALLKPLPMLVIRGALSDILSAETVEKMRAAKPDLRALSVATCGHAPTLDETECRSAIRSLLTSVSRAAA